MGGMGTLWDFLNPLGRHVGTFRGPCRRVHCILLLLMIIILHHQNSYTFCIGVLYIKPCRVSIVNTREVCRPRRTDTTRHAPVQAAGLGVSQSAGLRLRAWNLQTCVKVTMSGWGSWTCGWGFKPKASSSGGLYDLGVGVYMAGLSGLLHGFDVGV